jgi:hypothetical protein
MVLVLLLRSPGGNPVPLEGPPERALFLRLEVSSPRFLQSYRMDRALTSEQMGSVGGR